MTQRRNDPPFIEPFIFSENLSKAKRQVILNSAIATLNRQIELYTAVRASWEGQVQYESQLMKYYGLGDLITAYTIVVEDLKKVGQND